MMIIQNFITAGLRRYCSVCRKYFLKKSNLNVGRDRVQHVLWHPCNIDLPNSTQILILQCGTNNTNHNKTSTIANEIMKIATVLFKMSYQTNITITSLLLGNNNWSLHQRKIAETNRLL